MCGDGYVVWIRMARGERVEDEYRKSLDWCRAKELGRQGD
jgi:hypothetical protein